MLGAFTPVLAKRSKSFSLLHSFGVDRMQRNFEPMRKPNRLAGLHFWGAAARAGPVMLKANLPVNVLGTPADSCQIPHEKHD